MLKRWNFLKTGFYEGINPFQVAVAAEVEQSMKGYRHDDPVTAAALPYKQRDAEKKIATKQKRIETKLESELEGFFKPDTIFDAEAREAARELQERARETLLAGTTTWRDLHEEVAAIRKGDMGRAAALKPEPVAEAAPEAVSEAPPKPKRKRRRATPTPEPVAEAASEAVSEPEAVAEPKPKRKRRRATPTPEPVAEAASEAVATGDELYQGHKGPGIGYLKPDLPERRDGDGDTVVAERRPRKADEYETSPLPFPTPKTVTRLPASQSKPKSKSAPKPIVTGDVLYQGHKGPGIGYLKADLPERRDGDGDTVVAERRPRQSDLFDPSPMPVPPRLRGGRRPKAPNPQVQLIATKPERKRRRIPSFTLQKIEPSKRQKAAAAAGDMLKTFVLSDHFMKAVKEFFGEQMGNGHRTTRRKGREATTAAGGLGRRRGGTI